MTVFSNSAAASFISRKQVFPLTTYHSPEVSQRLVDAAHASDLKLALECLVDPLVDVNFIGTVLLRSMKTDLVLHDESAHEVKFEYEEFKTEVTALFLAAHAGNLGLVRKLLGIGANVNQKLFRGYATTAAVREGHLEILDVLVNAGASLAACEEALLEASYFGQARASELIMASVTITPRIAVHALVSASCRGFVDVVDTLIKCGVDANETSRILLQSSKPALHTNADCSPLVAAIVSRQISTVQLLLQAGVRKDTKVRLGAWLWDMATGEEFKVGAGLADPYPVTWCAVEYFEATGSILRMLLRYISPNSFHLGRTLVHHAILCGNLGAFDCLINCGVDIEIPINTTPETILHPLHMASRVGLANFLLLLIRAGCDLNPRSSSGETALMICLRNRFDECFQILASAGADFGLINSLGESASSIAESIKWHFIFQQTILDVIKSGKIPQSSDRKVFSALRFVTRTGDLIALKRIIEQPHINLDEQDENGFTAAMVAVDSDQPEAFRLLLYAGADINLLNKFGQTTMTLVAAQKNREVYEKVLIECELNKGNNCSNESYALHYAARYGHTAFICKLISKGNDVNALDSNRYTPLMLAAMSGRGTMCELLIAYGAQCDIENERHETALSLARSYGFGNDAERVVLDALARKVVLRGTIVKKHTKGGKGSPHIKAINMIAGSGILKWGKSSKRNVICKEAELGPSDAFRWNRRRKFDANEPGMFRVETTKNKMVHFVCDGGNEMAQLWVRGIKLVTREAICG